MRTKAKLRSGPSVLRSLGCLILLASLFPAAGSALSSSHSCAQRDPAIGENAPPIDLIFKSNGELISAPPPCLFADELLLFKVSIDDPFVEALVVGEVERYIRSIEAIKKLGELQGPKEFQRLGLGAPARNEVIKDLCERARVLAEATEIPTPRRNVLVIKLAELECAAKTGADTPFVPKDEPLTLSAVLRYYDADGVLQSPADGHVVPLQKKGKLYVSEAQKVEDHARLEYELRITDPLVERARIWSETHSLSGDLRKTILQEEKKLQKPEEVVKKLAPLFSCVQGKFERYKDQNLTPDDADAWKELEKTGLLKKRPCEPEILTSIEDAQSQVDVARDTVDKTLALLTSQEFTAWIKQWLWLTEGAVQLDPFRALSDPQSLKAALEQQEAKLAKLEAQVATFELIASNDGFAIEDPAKAAETVDRFSKAREERDALKKEIEKTKKQTASSQERSDQDTLLYRGDLYTSSQERSPNRFGAVMQHHDALHDYMVMAAHPIREIREQERLYILAANEKEDTQLKAIVTVTSIATDLSPITEEVRLSVAAADTSMESASPGILGPSEEQQRNFEAVKKFVSTYAELAERIAFLRAQLVPPPLLFFPEKDRTPALITRLIPHEVSPQAPEKVVYAINKKEGEQFVEVRKGEYRINKLYRIRLRAGAVYSELKRDDYTITTSTTGNVVTKSETAHGTDGTFGVHVYPFGKRDIRRPIPREWAWPSLYLGFAMDTDPLKNVFVGTGWEPWAGVSFLVGSHFGQEERLVGEGAAQRIDDKWTSKVFYGVTIDVDFFRQLFGLKGEL